MQSAVVSYLRKGVEEFVAVTRYWREGVDALVKTASHTRCGIAHVPDLADNRISMAKRDMSKQTVILPPRSCPPGIQPLCWMVRLGSNPREVVLWAVSLPPFVDHSREAKYPAP